MTAPRLPPIRLKQGEGRRVERGHAWVFSNEIATLPQGLADGGEAAVFAASGAFLGVGLYSAHALIAVRLHSRRSVEFDGAFLRQTLHRAASQRAELEAESDAFRLVFSEGDSLPGLIVDRYGRVLVVQLLTKPMDQRRELVLDALQDVFHPEAIVERSDSAMRALEGLPEVSGVVRGVLPQPLAVTLDRRAGLRMEVDVLRGQKTGLFLDQRANWGLLRDRARGKSLLDLFCHNGGWSLVARLSGAETVTAVDSSQPALDVLSRNAALSGVEGIGTVRADCFDFLRQVGARKFDIVVCDPPAFAKNRKNLRDALRGYHDLNRLSMRALAPGGVLVTCSCSHHVGRDDFDEMLVLAARDAGRRFILRPVGGQPADHPVLLGTPETEYLKVRVLEAME